MAVTMICGDCKDLMARTPDRFYDLAIVDPPYGIGAERGTNRDTKARFAGRKNDTWDSAIPAGEYFEELRRVSANQIIWGGNYFGPGFFKHFVVWDKGLRGLAFGDCELAVSTLNAVPRVFTFNPTLPHNRLHKIHPTEKPVALYKWLLTKYAKPGWKILDTHGGSGSHCIAAHDLGFDLDWIEKDAGFFEAASKRYRDHVAQGDFTLELTKPVPKNEELF